MGRAVIVSAMYGAVTMGCVVVGLIFLRHWRDSTDRLFLMFALAFGILAVDYAVLAVVSFGDEWRPYVFSVRLIAFGLIVFGIIEKNRRGS
jgi:hypothetical protein